MTLALVPKTHTNLSPSKAHRWLVCPGSVLVSDDDPESTWAAEGTRKHAALERVMAGDPLLAHDVVKVQLGDRVEDYKVPLEVIEQCIQVREYVEQWRAQHPTWTVEREVKVSIGHKVWARMPEGLCDGTADVAGWDWGELLVLDGKFGWVQVEPRDNAQLYLYALGLLSEMPFPVEHVCLVIAQPDYSGEMVFREHRTTPERLYQWALEKQGIVDEILGGSRRLQADDKACAYCPARTFCPARLKAVDDFNSDEWINAHRLEDLLPYVPRLKAIIRDLERKAVEKLANDEPVPGYKLVAARSKRRWSSDDSTPLVQAAQLALPADARSKVKVDDFYDRKLKSPAQMEKLLKPHLGLKAAKELVEPHAFIPQGKPKLVPADDERPALESGQFTLEDALKFSLEDGNGDAE